ncbi:hypothetical protein NHG25_06695 [Aerococcaceae bacterium NML191292]|nr:hypothetical protein [Aerococcaceae bacterium NML191292]MCW6681414.1 hypothetical protein [Aerococcaceae bacterium NML160702]
MKRYYTLLAAVLLGGCNLLQKDQPAPTESISSSVSSSQESATTSESSSSSSVEPTVISLFDESISGDMQYPKVSAPLTFSQEELMTAITEYYQSNYSANEKEANYSEIPADTLQEIQTYLQEDESIKSLNATVRQISFNLGEDKVYVAQVIVPMSFEKANQMLPENDFLLLNNVLAHLGNRLVMVAYYDEATQMLLPVHLTNNNNPLFYFSGE